MGKPPEYFSGEPKFGKQFEINNKKGGLAGAEKISSSLHNRLFEKGQSTYYHAEEHGRNSQKGPAAGGLPFDRKNTFHK